MSQKASYQCIFLLGLVSLLADATYDGLKSITGQYLGILGASGAVVGAVAGLGECSGHLFRISYKASTRKKTSSFFTLLGYSINALVAPLLALSSTWPVAAVLFVFQRFGKAVRRPPRDALLSHLAEKTGPGFGFGTHEALNRIGAVLGPAIVTLILLTQDSYALAFVLLSIPAIASLPALMLTRKHLPKRNLLTPKPRPKPPLSRPYWRIVAALSLIAGGTIHFSILSYHVQKTALFDPRFVPLLFSLAMATEGLAAIGIGHLYDRFRAKALIPALTLSLLSPPLIFLGSPLILVIGSMLWSVTMAILESLSRALITDFAPPCQRGKAFGMFHCCFALCWLIGSVLTGWLYDRSIPLMIGVAILIQASAIPVLWSTNKSH